jgi:hypothetical protein
MSGSFAMGRDPAFTSNFSLGGVIHCGESAPFFLCHDCASPLGYE